MNYNDMVTKYIQEDSSEVFGNFSTEHASFIIKSFMESAEKSIEILSGSFDEKFYKELNISNLLKNAARKLNTNGGFIRIITVDGIEAIHIRRTIEELHGENVNNVEYHSATYKGEKDINHFMLVDDKRYRLEAPHLQNFDFVKAEVCCNNPEKTKLIKKNFNEIFSFLAS